MQGCPDDRSIGFEVELVSFDKTPHWQNMAAIDKIARADQIRQQGNRVFKLGQLAMARQKYLKALKHLDSAFDTETDDEVSFCHCLESIQVFPVYVYGFFLCSW